MMLTKISCSAALALLLCLWGAVVACAVDTSVKIYDLAGLLTPQEEETLSQQARQLAEEYSMDIAAVLIDDNGGKSSMEYADDFFDENGFGLGSAYSGVLLLVDMEDRVVWISTSGQGITYFTDSRIDYMTAEIGPCLTQGLYAQGVKTFLDLAENYLQMPAPNQPVYEAVRPVQEQAQGKNYGRLALTALACGLGVGAVTIGVMLGGHGFAAQQDKGAYQYAEGPLQLSVKRDNYLRRHVTKSARQTSSSSGSRGSSVHRSSSGRSRLPPPASE